MKLQTALDLIDMAQHPVGYCVSYHERDGHLLRGGHFPDVRGSEKPIANENDAWSLAEQFSRVDPKRFFEIYVIRSNDFTPVAGYEKRILNPAHVR